MNTDVKPVLSVIIVSWNGRELLADCLNSLRAATTRHAREVIVVDNASQDGLPEMVRAHFPEVCLIANQENRGFAAANNQGIAASSGEYVMLLNPDTLLTQAQALDDMLDFMTAHPDVAACGPKLVFANGRHQVGDAGYAPTFSSVLAHNLFLSRIFPGGFKGIYVSAPKITMRRQALAVDWICGAACLVRRKVVEQVGGLDESIFMYAEDVEWGCRMRATGLRVSYLPGIEILHYGSSSEKQAAGGRISTRWLESLARLYRSHNNVTSLRGFRLAMGLGFLLRGSAYRILSLLRQNPDKATRATAMFAYARCAWRLDRDTLK